MAITSTLNKLQLALLLDMTCMSMMIVVFFPHIRSLGGSQFYTGVIMSVVSLIGLIWNPIIGSLGDTYGRKFILIRLLAMSAVSNLLLVITNSLVVIFISRILSAFSGPLVPIFGTAASELLKKEEQSSYFGRLPAVMSVSFILGALIGGFMSEYDNGTSLCFLIVVMINLTNLGVISTLPDNKKKNEDKQESLPILQIAQREVKNVAAKLTGVNWKEYSDIFSVKLCFELGCSLIFQCIGPTLVNFQVSGRGMGYVFTFNSVCTIIANIVLVNLKKTWYAEDKFGNKRLYHAAIMFVLTGLVMSSANGIYFFTSGLIFMSIARTISDSTFTEALMAKASEKDKGGVNGAFESIVSFAGLTTPILVGILSDLYGLKFVLRLTLVPTLAGLFLTYRNNT